MAIRHIKENQFQNTPTKEVKKNKSINISIKKKNIKWIALSFTLMLIVVYGITTQTRKVEGTWVRSVDDNGLAGMVVHVDSSDGITNGTIISIPNKKFNFKIGEIKWNNIKKIGWGTYEFYDLVSSDNGNINYYDSTSTLKVSLDGKTLTLTVNSTPTNVGKSGLYQIWKKQD